MADLIGALRLQSVRGQAAEIPGGSRRLLRGAGPLAVKAAALALAVAAAAAWRAYVPVANRIIGEEAGVLLRYPRGWHAGVRAGVVVQACELACDASRCWIGAPRLGCAAAFWRLAWSDFETLCGRALDPRQAGGGLDPAAEAVAAYVGLRGRLEVVGGLRLADRPAVMIRGSIVGRPAAVVVAPGPDLAFVLFQAPSERALREAWPLWTAMVWSARLIGPGPVAPVLLRPGSLIPLDTDG